MIELCESEIEALIRRGLLPPATIPRPLSEGLYAFFDRALTCDA
jgi:hypothetical protein